MQQLLTLLAIVSVVVAGCNDHQQILPTRQAPIASQADQQLPKVQEPTIPGDVSFSIIDSSTVPGIKRSLDVRLNKKVSERTLRAIALKLKAQDSRAYDRTFMSYYVPGMALGAGAWATTHFNPDLDVRILGLTAEDEIKLTKQPEPPNRKSVGRWLDESPFFGSLVTIFEEEGKLFIEQIFADGSSLKKELAEKHSPLGRRFDKVEGSSTGDHWVLGSDGHLQVRDKDGLIGTAKKIERGAREQPIAAGGTLTAFLWLDGSC